VLLPARRLVPVASRDDIELAVVVHVEGGAGEELGLGVNDVAMECEVTARAGRRHKEPRDRRQDQAARPDGMTGPPWYPRGVWPWVDRVAAESRRPSLDRAMSGSRDHEPVPPGRSRPGSLEILSGDLDPSAA